jgi:NAD(P)-dependent dehydrogenase (short-subunit alcohol dehydrogenase family)/acyl carrier protein
VNPGNYDDYRRLLTRLNQSGTIPRKIVHLWGVTSGGKDNINSLEESQNRGFYSLLFLTRAIVSQNGNDEFEITVVTDNIQKVTGDEIISPEKSTVLGPVFVIPQEHPNIACRSIDISISDLTTDREMEHLTRWIAPDLSDVSPGKITAYRNGRKWKPSVEHIPLDNDSNKWALKEKGVYLITGGPGGVGYALAGEFAKACSARLLFVGRTQLPGREEWDNWLSSHDERDTVSQKIKRLRALEKIGSDVLYFSADVSDAEAMKNVIALAENRFGEINGIVHAAGGTKGESIGVIRNLDRAKCGHQFRAKIDGLMVLDRLFGRRELDFVLLISSMSSFLGGWEYTAYTAANLFMDRFVLETGKWISVNLDPVNLDGDKNPDTSLTIAETIQIFKCILANIEKGQILVSIQELQTRIEKASRPLNADKANRSRTDDFFPRPHLTTPYLPPTDEIESGLVEICRELFGYDRVGIMDNFFELGGNSLTLMQFIDEIQEKFKVRLHVQDIFEKEHIRELSKFIREAEKETHSAIEPVEQKEYYPLSSAQERLYAIQQLEEEFTGYNVPWPFRLRGFIDKKKLEDVFRKIIRRHESLRTCFHQVDGYPVQKVRETIEFTITYKEAAGVPGANEIIERFVRSFDLSLAPLLRAVLIKLDENDHVLMIDIHHIICDWHSMNIFKRDFAAFCMNNELPPLKLQYKDYSHWQGAGAQREAIGKQEEYWLSRFKNNIPILDLPTDIQGGESHDFTGERIGFGIDGHLAGEIKKILLETGTTLFMMLLSVYTVLLSIYTGREDIVVGVPTAGRNHKDLADILGMFVNMLPMRNNPRPGKAFRQFLKEVKENSIRDFENQDYPFDRLVSKLGLPRHSNKTPLVETMLTMLGAPVKSDNETVSAVRETLEVETWPYEKHPAKFALALDVLDHNGSIHLWLTYSTRLYKRSTAEKVKTHYVEILEQVVKNADTRLEDIAISHELAQAGPGILRDDSGDFAFGNVKSF